MTDFELRGWEGLDRLVRELPKEIDRQKLLQAAANAGGRVIRDEARQRVPVRTGRLRAQIRTFVRRTGVGIHQVAVAIGVRGGGKGGRAHIARFLEFGVGPHTIEPKTRRGKRKAALLLSMGVVREKVDHPGHAPEPFLRPAFDAKKQAALDAMAAALRKGIDRAVAKLRSTGGGK